MRGLILDDNLYAASQDEESGCEVGELCHDIDFLQRIDKFDSTFWSEMPSNTIGLC